MGIEKQKNKKIIVFSNTPLMQLQFKAIKEGNVSLRFITTPNSFADTNIIDTNTENILGSTSGLTITINK